MADVSLDNDVTTSLETFTIPTCYFEELDHDHCVYRTSNQRGGPNKTFSEITTTARTEHKTWTLFCDDNFTISNSYSLEPYSSGEIGITENVDC